MPTLFPQKSSPPLEKTPEEKMLLIRNCLSQESIRQPLSAPKELAKPGTAMSSRKPLNLKTFNFHQRTPSAHSNCQSPITKQKNEIESSSELENTTGLADPSSNNKFVIKTRGAKNKVKVTKFNKIKVISAIPGIENSTPKAEPLLSKVPTEKKLLRLDTKKKNSLEISIEEIKGLQNSHAYSCHSRGLNAFVFPDIAPTKVKGVSPVTHLCLDGVLPNTMSVPVTLKRIPSISQKCVDFEALKALLERKTYTAEPESNPRVKISPLEDNKFPLSGNLNLASLISPPVRSVSNIYSFKSPTGNELNTPTSAQGHEIKIKLHKRANPKFKNEEAVLDKLFKPSNPKKE